MYKAFQVRQSYLVVVVDPAIPPFIAVIVNKPVIVLYTVYTPSAPFDPLPFDMRTVFDFWEFEVFLGRHSVVVLVSPS